MTDATAIELLEILVDCHPSQIEPLKARAKNLLDKRNVVYPKVQVAPSLKKRFEDWIDKRTAVGVRKYGEPLATFNRRSEDVDMIEELLDFCQYQEQSRMKLSMVAETMRVPLTLMLEEAGHCHDHCVSHSLKTLMKARAALDAAADWKNDGLRMES